jgi:hypothetical protein
MYEKHQTGIVGSGHILSGFVFLQRFANKYGKGQRYTCR